HLSYHFTLPDALPISITKPEPCRRIRYVSCGVSCSSSTTRRRGAVSVSPPKPTSATYLLPSTSTVSSMCVRGGSALGSRSHSTLERKSTRLNSSHGKI